MAAINLRREIKKRTREPTHRELRDLFRSNVCNKTPDEILRLFKSNELKRVIAVRLYDRFVFPSQKNRSIIIGKIADLLLLSPRSIKRYCPYIKEGSKPLKNDK